MNSSLYECEVYHERFKPKSHRFRYKLFLMDLDLDELPLVSKRMWLFSRNRFNLFAFRDRDHLRRRGDDLRRELQDWLAERGVQIERDAKIRLVTMPRILGYGFNPVSFFFVEDRQGNPVFSVVEVCNTFREIKAWLLDVPSEAEIFRKVVPKHFYVSPFSNLTTCFDFSIGVPREDLKIAINDLENDEITLVSWIRGRRRPLTDARLAWYALRYPVLTLQVMVKIHWQALRLWAKGLPFIRKADQVTLQREILSRPGPSTNSPTTHS